MIAFLKKNPLHCILISWFMTLFLYGHNTDLVEIHIIYRTLFYGTLISLAIYGISYFFVREKTKAGIITSAIILILFNYGVIYDFVEGLYYQGFWPFKSIHRYLVFLCVIIIITMIWVIKYKIIVGQRINYFFNLLVIFLICFNLFKIIIKKTTSNSYSSTAIKYTSIPKLTTSNVGGKLPNIYFMVLDGYANQSVLKTYYQFDNSPFIDFLKSKGFYIADSSSSNYYNTYESLSSTLNMTYLEKSMIPDFNKIRDNKVVDKLKAYGYKTYRLESGYAVTGNITNIDSTISINVPNEFERCILKYTICRLDDIFGFIPYARLKSQVEKLNDITTLANVSPKFVFIHIVAPHPPFVFNKKGERTFTKKDNDNSWEPKEKYIDQLLYINEVTQDFIQKISVKDPTSIFILQSDHGPYITSKKTDDIFKARSLILNAIKCPDLSKQEGLYKKISSINTFRFIFKNYIDSSYHLIPDIHAGKEELVNSLVFKTKVIK